MDYSKKDVEFLAQAILDTWEDHASTSRYQCRYCSGYRGSEYPVKSVGGYSHALDCIVLIAEDILTK